MGTEEYTRKFIIDEKGRNLWTVVGPRGGLVLRIYNVKSWGHSHGEIEYHRRKPLYTSHHEDDEHCKDCEIVGGPCWLSCWSSVFPGQAQFTKMFDEGATTDAIFDSLIAHAEEQFDAEDEMRAKAAAAVERLSDVIVATLRAVTDSMTVPSKITVSDDLWDKDASSVPGFIQHPRLGPFIMVSSDCCLPERTIHIEYDIKLPGGD